MLVNKQQEYTNNINNFICYKYKNITMFLNGLLYIDGYHAGQESLKYISKFYSNYDAIDFEKLKGAFSLFIIDKNKVLAFSDNSNMHCLYYNENYIGNRLIELVKQLRRDKCILTINERAVF